MIIIDDYILNTKEFRQSHLRLNEPCIFRGTVALECRALLAHKLNTTVPRGNQIHLCHACNEGTCSNPYHLYWGTAKENIQDSINNGTNLMIVENIRRKHGVDGLSRIARENALKTWARKRIWITNGVICKRVHEDQIPEGWHKGRPYTGWLDEFNQSRIGK